MNLDETQSDETVQTDVPTCGLSEDVSGHFGQTLICFDMNLKEMGVVKAKGTF